MEIASSGCRRKRQKGEARETERSFQLEALGLLLRFTPKFSPRFPFSRRNLSTGERFKHGTQPRPKHTQQPYVASSSREKIASIYGTLCYITVHSIFMLCSMPVMFAEIFSRSSTTRKSAFKVFLKKNKNISPLKKAKTSSEMGIERNVFAGARGLPLHHRSHPSSLHIRTLAST